MASSAVKIRTAPLISKDSTERPLMLGITFQAHREPKIPIGILIKKMLAQPKVAVRKPPKTGPAVRAIDTVIPITPRAFPRCWGGVMLVIIAGPIAIIIPAPMAWRARKIMRAKMLGANPHNREPIVKTANPER